MCRALESLADPLTPVKQYLALLHQAALRIAIDNMTQADTYVQVSNPLGDRKNTFDTSKDVAVVGLSLRFPQDGNTVEGFWKMLVEGQSAMTEVPKDRWNAEAFYHPDAERKDTVESCLSTKSASLISRR